MLMAYMLRYSLSSSMSHDDTLNPVGKTVGNLITNEQDFEAKQKQEQADQDRLAAEARAKEDAIHEQLRDCLTLAVSYKTFVAANYQSDLQDAIWFGCDYQNKSKKDIRAFTGDVEFDDLFGNKIKGFHITIEDPVQAGKQGTWSGFSHYNQFEDEDVQFKNTDMNNMKVKWLPSSIIF